MMSAVTIDTVRERERERERERSILVADKISGYLEYNKNK